MEPVSPLLIDCVEPSPREPRAVGPMPPADPDPDRISDAAEASLDLTGELIEFVRDVAAWTETVDPGAGLDYGDFEDLEQLGRRAHDLHRRIREAMEL